MNDVVTTAPMRFGEFLCENQLISEEQLLALLADCWSNGGRLDVMLCRHGVLSPKQIARWVEIFYSVGRGPTPVDAEA